ncbi:MAG: Gfo/Idh/MocA family protein, partial [Pirellulales bacterium]
TPYLLDLASARGAPANDKPTSAAIGVGGRGSGIGRAAAGQSNMVACADVDLGHAKRFARPGYKVYKDYRKIIERDDIDLITCGTPDHWHSKIVIEALQSGKHVYCEKPLTLTIDEGKKICEVAKKAGRVMQVGTQQRSVYGGKFLRAVALAQSGRLGKKLTATCSIGGGPCGGPWDSTDPPKNLDWDFWLGQTPVVPYTQKRCHFTFRWWLEYSGGKMTDWGAHHLDIGQWGLGYTDSGPIEVEAEGDFCNHPDDFDPQKFFAGEQTIPNGYNTATKFQITLTYENGNKMIVRHGPGNGVLFEGEKGRIFVNRGRLTGKPIEELSDADKKWLDEEIVKLHKGTPPGSHMQDFFDAVHGKKENVSDVFTHHRTMTACHLCNIGLLLKRKLRWDPKKEDFLGDEVASALRSRPQRKPYQIEV